MSDSSSLPDAPPSVGCPLEMLPVRTLRQIGRHRDEGGHASDLLLAVWLAGRSLRAELLRLMRPLGLSDVKFSTLLALYAVAPESTTPADLAYHSGVSRSCMNDTLAQLEGCGWVERINPNDRRAARIALSGDGRVQVERAIELFFGEVERLSRNFTTQQCRDTASVCNLLARVLWERSPHQPVT